MICAVPVTPPLVAVMVAVPVPGSPEVTSDPEQLMALEVRRSELQGQIDTLYSEWERLTDELSAIEDGRAE